MQKYNVAGVSLKGLFNTVTLEGLKYFEEAFNNDFSNVYLAWIRLFGLVCKVVTWKNIPLTSRTKRCFLKVPVPSSKKGFNLMVHYMKQHTE